MNNAQTLNTLARGGISVKTVRYNNVEFKQGTARMHVTGERNGYVEIVGRQHTGHEILVRFLAEFSNAEEREYYKEQAMDIVDMLNS